MDILQTSPHELIVEPYVGFVVLWNSAGCACHGAGAPGLTHLPPEGSALLSIEQYFLFGKIVQLSRFFLHMTKIEGECKKGKRAAKGDRGGG